ncbi:hypothetical protein OED52_06185 [Rhodococcus sp. Z13]|uniref:Uncharacterized protein n=1 Tax=Rhodococcus sacchari TaxID=2962047 RepID=A0ACD4DK97_9NOCA|nr:hypothetical protein [Rhodococcus sp. Z13]UYP20128.1 hypothetical protein OED52_06185 [Rhodococcus sp. Z13]
MTTVLAKVLLWVALLAGLIGAGAAVYRLHVHATVAALIVASVAGLVLLRLRAEARDTPDRDTAVS